MKNFSPRRRTRLLAAVALLALGGGPSCGAPRATNAPAPPRTIAGLALDGLPLGGLDRAQLLQRLQRAARSVGARTVLLRWPHGQQRATLAELGFSADVALSADAALSVGHSGHWLADLLLRIRARGTPIALPWQLALDSARGEAYFRRLAAHLDRDPSAPRIDPQRRRVLAGHPGLRLDPLGALAATTVAVRAGRRRVDLPLLHLPAPAGPALTGLDLGHVLGRFSTVYSLADVDRDRAHNLQLVASRLDGQLLAPGARLSFNSVVGPRGEAQGYRMAAVVQQGELIDGMAGGACQISSTLFAAAFFAGLELISSRPHSMPSSYIRLGLDATVAYPHTDLVLGNPYRFPVALHVRVNRGTVRVEILGRRRPWARVALRREVKARWPFPLVERDDPALPLGQRWIVQHGVLGFEVERQRLFFAPGGALARRETRLLRYPATPEVARVGSGPAAPEAPGAGPTLPSPYRADVTPLWLEQ